MADIRIQKPLDQPSGNFRLLNELITNLKNNNFREFRIITAFAKEGAFLKLQPFFDKWKADGKLLKCILGVDENGTSKEAIEFVLNNFDDSYIARVGTGAFHPTFHPKIYLFIGQSEAIAYIGSNNMTIGGLEINAESFIELKMKLPYDQILLDDILKCWDETLSICLPLNKSLLDELVASKIVISEVEIRSLRTITRAKVEEKKLLPTIPNFPAFKVVPPSSYPIPRAVRTKPNTVKPIVSISPAIQSPITNAAETFVIQIIPHHNGEIFLSKIAIDQNPIFFGWPFTGSTIPKIASNPSYPQRNPDPVINLHVYDDTNTLILNYPNINLNTVYYAPKSEIRITVPPEIYRNVKEYSIMVIQLAVEEGTDYNIFIYNPGSNEFNDYLKACNQTMPSGGRPVARKFGWL